MAEQQSPGRPLRLALVALVILDVVAAAVALWLVRDGRGPVLAVRVQRVLAYAWVAVTIAGALGAFALARGAVGLEARRRLLRTLAGAALADFAALAGVIIFWLVRVWPMLVVALLVALLGLVLGWPAGRMLAATDPAPEKAEQPR